MYGFNLIFDEDEVLGERVEEQNLRQEQRDRVAHTMNTICELYDSLCDPKTGQMDEDCIDELGKLIVAKMKHISEYSSDEEYAADIERIDLSSF